MQMLGQPLLREAHRLPAGPPKAHQSRSLSAVNLHISGRMATERAGGMVAAGTHSERPAGHRQRLRLRVRIRRRTRIYTTSPLWGPSPEQVKSVSDGGSGIWPRGRLDLPATSWVGCADS